MRGEELFGSFCNIISATNIKNRVFIALLYVGGLLLLCSTYKLLIVVNCHAAARWAIKFMKKKKNAAKGSPSPWRPGEREFNCSSLSTILHARV